MDKNRLPTIFIGLRLVFLASLLSLSLPVSASVTLSRFEVVPDESAGGLKVQWETATELDTLLFRATGRWRSCL